MQSMKTICWERTVQSKTATVKIGSTSRHQWREHPAATGKTSHHCPLSPPTRKSHIYPEPHDIEWLDRGQSGLYCVRNWVFSTGPRCRWRWSLWAKPGLLKQSPPGLAVSECTVRERGHHVLKGNYKGILSLSLMHKLIFSSWRSQLCCHAHSLTSPL